MKHTKRMFALLLYVFVLYCMSACGKQQTAKLANEMVFPLEGIKSVAISYDDETVTFFEGESDSLIIREYMSENKKAYRARVNQGMGSIQVSEGEKPFFQKGFIRYVEVYLPQSYSGNLEVTATDGCIDMSEVEVSLKSFRVDCTSGIFELKKASAEEIYFSSTRGKLELGDIEGEQIRIETTQGEVSCERGKGNITYTSTSGNAEFRSVSGAGVYRAENSGKLAVVYEEVTGDLSFYNKNDEVEIELPAKLSFAFEAVTKNGSIQTNFQEELSVNSNQVSGTVGNAPEVTVKVETKNGNIRVNR